MNYKDIYNSYMENIKSIEKNYNLTEKGSRLLVEIKSKLKTYNKKLKETATLKEFEHKLDYYTTVDYSTRFKDLRRKVIYKYGEMTDLANDIEKLFYLIEKEKN